MHQHPNRFYQSSIQDLTQCYCRRVLYQSNKELYNRCSRKKNNSTHPQGLTLTTKKPTLHKLIHEPQQPKANANHQTRIKEKVILGSDKEQKQNTTIIKVTINYINKVLDPLSNQVPQQIIQQSPQYTPHKNLPKFITQKSYNTLNSTKYSPQDETQTPSYQSPIISRLGSTVSALNLLQLQQTSPRKHIRDFDDIREVRTVVEGSMGTINEEMQASQAFVEESIVEWTYQKGLLNN